MKLSFWNADWFLGLLIALAFLFAAHSALLQGLERKAYNLGVQASNRMPGLAFLQTQPEQRYQTREFTHDLLACTVQISSAGEK